MEKEELQYAAERIEHLEKIFDEVTEEFKNNPSSLENESFLRKVSLLTQYMESGQWLRDFELDDKGELPKELKRGILSEDALYNLICDIDLAKKKKESFLSKLLGFFKKN